MITSDYATLFRFSGPLLRRGEDSNSMTEAGGPLTVLLHRCAGWIPGYW